MKQDSDFIDTKIKRFLDDMPANKRKLALRVREIVLGVDKGITERLKWRNLTFLYKGNLAWIINYNSTDYINFGFFKATELSDPKHLLEGTGKGLRHVKIISEKDIDKKQVEVWVRQAMGINSKN